MGQRIQPLEADVGAALMALAEGLRQEFAGTRYRSILINPPYLDDARPDQPHWTAAPDRHKGERATTRDVVEAALFALARPRSISLTIEMDADDGGLFPSAGNPFNPPQTRTATPPPRAR